MKKQRLLWLAGWGCLWVFGGFSLLKKGLYFLFVQQEGIISTPLVNFLSRFMVSRNSAVFLLTLLALIVGILKGRTVIGKSAQRVVNALSKEKIAYKPIILTAGILAVMVGLGFLINALKLPQDVRGFIDLVIGSALLQGSWVFFRALNAPKPTPA